MTNAYEVKHVEPGSIDIYERVPNHSVLGLIHEVNGHQLVIPIMLATSTLKSWLEEMSKVGASTEEYVRENEDVAIQYLYSTSLVYGVPGTSVSEAALYKLTNTMLILGAFSLNEELREAFRQGMQEGDNLVVDFSSGAPVWMRVTGESLIAPKPLH
jgi:hypothetical protein